MLREEMEKIPRLQQQLDKDCERLAALEEMAAEIRAVPTDKEKVMTSHENRSMVVADKAIDLHLKVKEEQKELRRLRNEAVKVIKKAELEPSEREVMTLRYVDGLLWQAVADIMCYDMAYTQRKNRKAMEKIFEKSHTMSYEVSDNV